MSKLNWNKPRVERQLRNSVDVADGIGYSDYQVGVIGRNPYRNVQAYARTEAILQRLASKRLKPLTIFEKLAKKYNLKPGDEELARRLRVRAYHIKKIQELRASKQKS